VYKNVNIKIYRTNLQSLTLTEEYGMDVSENKVPREIFGPKRDGII
jgi:hypothetical protein